MAEVGIGEEVVAKPLPSFVEPDPRLHLVFDLERGRQSCIERVLREDAMGEAVKRRDRRHVETIASSRTALTLIGREVRIDRRELERAPHAVPQLGGRCFGERDGDEIGDVAHRARGDETHDSVDKDPGLARAGARLDEQIAVQVVTDASAAVVIHFEQGMGSRERRHAPASSAGSSPSAPTSSASST